MTGIPLTRLEKAEAERLLQHGGRARQGRDQPGRRDQGHRALGAALALGPQGPAPADGLVRLPRPLGRRARRYLCKQLAKFMFGDEDAVITIDMSEYMEKHNASRLVGAPPGYVGYEEGGQLTEKVRRRPVLGGAARRDREGPPRRLQHAAADHGGRPADRLVRPPRRLQNVILIMTSQPRLGRSSRPAGLGFGKADQQQSAEDRKRRMKADVMIGGRAPLPARVPEPRRRADRLQPAHARGPAAHRRAAAQRRARAPARAAASRLELDQKAVDFLIGKGFSEDFGARPLRRAIERFVEDPLAEQLLRFEGKAYLIRVTVAEDQKSLLFQQEQAARPDPLPEHEPVTAGDSPR